ncbi:MAG: cholesterol oxidase [Gaiellaceae bacterium]|nr:cholesterol oxidase [Gaiellaceae bacterium]
MDVLVVGSGFGGSVAALRLTEKGYRVAVLEAGRRFAPGDFARRNWNLRRYLFVPRLGLRGIQRLTWLDDLVVLSGAGVGGGSLVYANTLVEPLEPFYDDPQWSAIADWRRELGPHYETARRMLGAVETPFETAAEAVVRQVAAAMGVVDTFRPTTVAVDFDTCVRCGGCMVGCRYGAKNTLDRNYLRLAEEGGAVVHPEREATLLRRTERGWQVETQRSGAWARRQPQLFEAEHVVLAAGVLGTLKLLLRSGVGGPRVGELVRSNSEVIVGAGARNTSIDYSEGIAIGSSFHANAETQIEPVRYPRGSSLMGLFSTVLVDGGGRSPRPLRWLATVARHPLEALQAHVPWRWAERTVILLVMQARDNALRIRWTGKRLRTERGGGEPSPTWIPEANEAARLAAAAMGGRPGSALNEVILNRPFTAHILGGAAIGATREDGVIDAWHRVWTEPGLHVVDGSAVSANLGANPALTIAAQAERAMSFWPHRGEPDVRPPLGADYAAVRPSLRSASNFEHSRQTVRSSS